MTYISQTLTSPEALAAELARWDQTDQSLNKPAAELLRQLQGFEKSKKESDLVTHSQFASGKKQADKVEYEKCLRLIEQFLQMSPLRPKLQAELDAYLSDLKPSESAEALCVSVLGQITFCIDQRRVFSFNPADNPWIVIPLFRPLAPEDVKFIFICVEKIGLTRDIQPNLAITESDLNALFRNAQLAPVDIVQHPILRGENYLYRTEFMSLDKTVNLNDAYPQEISLLPLPVVNQIIDKITQKVLAAEKKAIASEALALTS